MTKAYGHVFRNNPGLYGLFICPYHRRYEDSSMGAGRMHRFSHSQPFFNDRFTTDPGRMGAASFMAFATGQSHF